MTSLLFPPLSRRTEPGLPVVALENRLRSLLAAEVPLPFKLLAMLADELDSLEDRGVLLVWVWVWFCEGRGGELAGGKCAELALRPREAGPPRLLVELCDDDAPGTTIDAYGAASSPPALAVLLGPFSLRGVDGGDASRAA